MFEENKYQEITGKDINLALEKKKEREVYLEAIR